MNVLIVAAGTGGHITPGISIANKIKREHKDAKILFIGTKNGIENDIVKKAGYNIEHIRAEGIRREITIENIRRAFNLILGIKDAKKIIKRFKPDIVIGTGGYVCFPIFKVATKLKIPTMLHESNSIPGKVVTTMAKKVDTILIGFEETKEKIKGAKNIVYTGTPNKMVTYIPENNLREKLDLRNDLPIVLITGGSQGAKRVNEFLIDIICNDEDKNYQMVFVTGPKQYDNVMQKISDRNCNIEKLKNVKILPFVYNMEEYMAVADLMIGRAGALSLTEICVMGKPSILIPYPYAAENHQEYNAKILEKNNASVVLTEKELTSQKLNNTINDLMNNKEKLLNMSKAARNLAILDVEDRIYVEIKKLLKGKI